MSIQSVDISVNWGTGVIAAYFFNRAQELDSAVYIYRDSNGNSAEHESSSVIIYYPFDDDKFMVQQQIVIAQSIKNSAALHDICFEFK